MKAARVVDERDARWRVRELAGQAFSRAAGAPLIAGNSVRILKDGVENYPAWLEAIRAARHHVHFENYIFQDDAIGKEFAAALIGKAREGVAVRVLYDWFGSLGKATRRYWNSLRAQGVQVHRYNPPQLDSPLGWLSRDHRKMVAVDGTVAFVSGMCVGAAWMGDPAKGVEPWRDTGVEIRGPAVAEIERAFARMWTTSGAPEPGPQPAEPPAEAGMVSLRIVASEPATTGMVRLDQLVAALARKRLWICDAYYAGGATYTQALRAAAKDGVDVRLLLPNSTDVPLIRPLSRAGYRPLLEAGVRVFEWNGSMMHAKTAVADGRWARVGSTNLNITSWLGNCELDAVMEDEPFAAGMERMYLEDLAHATEVVLDRRRRLSMAGERRSSHPFSRRSGSARRAAAGALRLGNTLSAALANRRVLGPIEARLTTMAGLLLVALSALFAVFPRVLAYPLVLLGAWAGLSLLYRGWKLHRERKGQASG